MPRGAIEVFELNLLKQYTAVLAFALNLTAVSSKYIKEVKNGYYHLSSVLLPIIQDTTFFTLIHSHLLSSFSGMRIFLSALPCLR